MSKHALGTIQLNKAGDEAKGEKETAVPYLIQRLAIRRLKSGLPFYYEIGA